MAIMHGPYGAKLKYDADEVDPWSIGGEQKEWKCLEKDDCDWPHCRCDPIAATVLDQTYTHELYVPVTSTNHALVKAHNKWIKEPA
jgi:hypothetical protein